MKGLFDSQKLTGYLAVALAVLYPTGAILLPPFFGKSVDFLFSAQVIVSYWGSVAALVIGFVVIAAERAESATEYMRTREFDGVEFFGNADDFLKRLSEISVGAESIATLNLSPPAGSSHALDRYFKILHPYIAQADTPLKSFRSIATIEGASKADWIIARSALFQGNPRVSLSCFQDLPGLRLMCYHVVFKNNVGYTAFYPPVPLSGVMSAFLIVNVRLAKLMSEQFEIAWARSVPVLTGGIAIAGGLEFLAGRGARPEERSFRTLASGAVEAIYE